MSAQEAAAVEATEIQPAPSQMEEEEGAKPSEETACAPEAAEGSKLAEEVGKPSEETSCATEAAEAAEESKLAEEVGKPSEEPGCASEAAEESKLAEQVARVIGECGDLSKMTMKGLRAEVEQRLGLAEGGLDAQRNAVEQLAREQLQNRALETPSKSKAHKRPRRSAGSAPPQEKRQRVQKAVSNELPAEVTAELLPVTMAGVSLKLGAKTFPSGRQGFFASQGIPITAGGKKFEVHCMVQCAVVDLGAVSEEEEDQQGEEEAKEEGGEDKQGNEEVAVEPSQTTGTVAEESTLAAA